MAVESYITDPQNDKKAEVDDADETEKRSLVVVTRPLKVYDNALKFFLNDDYGADMNQDASPGGTPEKVHDGIDSSLWTASDIVGGAKTTFDSTDQAHGGSKSVKVDNSPVDDVFQFDKGGDLDASAYVSITIWIYVDKDWKVGDSISIFGWDTGTGLSIGDAANLEDYFDWFTFDTWHKISIPLTDMGALASSTILDALRVRIVSKEGKSPKFYLDDIQFEQSGTPVAFTVKPDTATWLWVDSIKVTMADGHAGTLADATMPLLAYNKLLSQSELSVGMVFHVHNKGKSVFTATVKKLIDIMQFPGSEIVGYGSDGTNSWISFKIVMSAPFLLKSEDGDNMEITISENLTGLIFMRWLVDCRVEIRKSGD